VIERERRRDVPSGQASRAERTIRTDQTERTGRTAPTAERNMDVDVLVVNQTVPNDTGAGEEPIVSRLLDGVSLDVQEAWICEDMMFVLQVRCSCRIFTDLK
jgi:gamma-tubulin complex component 2